jgi:hypothetical protein
MADQLAYRVRAASTGWGGAPGLNTFYFDQNLIANPDEDAMAADCVARVQAAFVQISLVFPTSWIVQVSGEVDVINSDNGDLVSSHAVTPPAPHAGQIGGGFGPQVAMICASYLTSGILDSRRVRGRCFLGPLRSGADPDGTPVNADVAVVQTNLDTLRGGTLGHPPLVVWSRRRGVSGRHPTGLGGSTHVVTGVTVRDTYATLRSRRQ